MEPSGGQFLHLNDEKLHQTAPVEHEMKRQLRKGEEASLEPADKLAAWMNVLERTHMGHRDDPRVLERIKKYYHREHVIASEDIPESYFKTQQRLAREQGHGNIEITDAMRRQFAEVIIADQTSSLDNWIEYVTSPDLDGQPMWVKYWAFTSMLQLSTYDKEQHAFGHRIRGTVAPFPDLNREALAYVMDALVKKYGQEYFSIASEIIQTQQEIDRLRKKQEKHEVVDLVAQQISEDPQAKIFSIITADGKRRIIKKKQYLDMVALIATDAGIPTDNLADLEMNLSTLTTQRVAYLEDKALPEIFLDEPENEVFGKLYAWAIEKATPAQESELRITDGEWITYDKGSDHMPLVTSLQGHGTGWCTAGEQTAKSQLEKGDFYVYYSFDKDNRATIPRIAIRMEGQSIAEVRGIAAEQNLDPFIAESNLLDDKLKDFGEEGERYQKRSADMKLLTAIEHKTRRDETLSSDELRFLYEFDGKIEGFGYRKDPRVQEIISGRNVKADISRVTGFSEDQISTTKEEALKGGIQFHYGDLDLTDLSTAKGLTLPNSVSGSVYLNRLTSAEGLTLPTLVGGNLSFSNLTSAEGLILPNSVGGYLSFNCLTSAKGLTLPSSVGSLSLNGLTSAEGLILPNSVGDYLSLNRLTSAEGLTFPNSVGGNLILSSLTSAEGLILPSSVDGVVFLNSLTLAEKDMLRLRYPDLARKIR